MTDIARLTNAEIAKQIKLHFATASAIETAECHLRACAAPSARDALPHLTLLSVEIGNVLRDLITERSYREGTLRRSCDKAA